ncbi:MAG TPA: glycosyltransferase [Mycobacteriales bacterium]|nr:glycosyltransferase [Mycobacteriales bacterium]
MHDVVPGSASFPAPSPAGAAVRGATAEAVANAVPAARRAPDRWHRPRIGIYNRWMSTLGGGERYMAALARLLAESYQVELIGHETVDLSRCRDVLGTDLTGVPQRVVPLDADYRAVQQASAEYDVFLNISQGDIFPALARVNALVVFFPGPPPPPVPGDAEPIGPLAAGWPGLAGLAGLSGPRAVPLSGLYPPEQGLERFVRWTGPELRLRLEDLPGTGPAAVRLVASGLRARGVPSAEIALHDERGLLERWRLPNRRFFGITVPLPEPRPNRMVLRLTTNTFVPAQFGADDDRELGVAVADVSVLTGSSRRHVDYFPEVGPVFRGWTPRRRALWEQSTYDLLLTVSRFGDDWTDRRWGRRGELLYPPVSVERVTPAPKRNVVLGTGAFSPGAADPGHLAMVAMFRRLCDQGLTDWELVLAGSTDPDGGAGLAAVLRAAEGYPIMVLPDPGVRALRQRYAEARIFWDATGLGVDDRLAPHAFEPFAVGAVEAMAVGCVPVAVRRASLPEIVSEGRSGLLWDTPAQCVELTRALIADPTRRDWLAEGAVAASLTFGEAAFRARLTEITTRIEHLLNAAT